MMPDDVNVALDLLDVQFTNSMLHQQLQFANFVISFMARKLIAILLIVSLT